MSDYMLSDKHSMDKVNPFVVDEFSLPGGIRETDRTEIEEYYTRDSITRKRPSDREQKLIDKIGIHEIHKTNKSPFCETHLCDKQKKQNVMNKVIHPRRNIDYGVSCKVKKPKVVRVGVSNAKKHMVPDATKAAIVVLIILMLVYALRR